MVAALIRFVEWLMERTYGDLMLASWMVGFACGAATWWAFEWLVWRRVFM